MKLALKMIAILVGATALGALMFGAVVIAHVADIRPALPAVATTNVYAVRGVVMNAYAIRTSEGIVMIDAGDKPESIAASLSFLEIDANEVIAVFLTHCDTDHVAALEVFPRARVYFPNEEIQYLTGEKERKAMFLRVKIALPVSRYTKVSDEQTFRFGNVTIKAIATPGHTAGSMSFLVNDAYLFTGDLLALRNGEAEPSNWVFSEDIKTSAQSIRRLARYGGIALIGTGHTGYTADADRAFARWR